VSHRILLGLLLGLLPSCARGIKETPVAFDRFGTVTVYQPPASSSPSQVTLLISGERGWSGEVIEMARALAAANTLVVGVDLRRYLHNLAGSWDRELYPEADFEALSQFTQKKLGLKVYIPPVLIGYEEGAAFAYVTLAQAAPNTFRGAVSIAFCPDIVVPKPLGREYELDWAATGQTNRYRLLPASGLSGPWIVLQGAGDEICSAVTVRTFVQQVAHGELVELPDIGHEFPSSRSWMSQLRDAVLRIAATQPSYHVAAAAEVRDLPLIEVPASGSVTDVLAVIISGDGGWASIDRQIGNVLASRGIAVVGLNSLQYFWTRRTPEQAAADLTRILRHYLSAWHKQKVILAGYSLGADVLPFMTNRLPNDLLSQVSLIVLMGPALSVSFEFHLTDWLWSVPRKAGRPILPEVEKLRRMKVLCVYGAQEEDTLCKRLSPGLASEMKMPGGHHFGGDYETIAQRIVKETMGDSVPRGEVSANER
jgi:type IV secretory pathway VirJ component